MDHSAPGLPVDHMYRYRQACEHNQPRTGSAAAVSAIDGGGGVDIKSCSAPGSLASLSLSYNLNSSGCFTWQSDL